MKNNKSGKIIIPSGASVWDHELHTVKALSAAGYVITFLATKNEKHHKSPDVFIGGQAWEIKCPIASKLSAIERNLKKAYHQSYYIIFDSHRMGRLPDASIQKELVKQYRLTKNIKQILFVNRKRQVIDISKHI